MDSPGTGSIHLYVGTAITDDLVISDLEAPTNVSDHDNKNLDRAMFGLDHLMRDEERMFELVLQTNSDIVVEDFVFRRNNGSDIFALSLDASFSVQGQDDLIVYQYLDFLMRVRPPNVDPDDDYAKLWADREIETIRRCSVSIVIDLAPGMTMDLQHERSDHYRGPSGEGLDREIDLYEFLTHGNEVIVSDNPLLSPVGTLVITIAVTALGYIGLGLIWWRNLFKGVGLILPSFTLIVSIVPLLVYFNPQLNGYKMMDLFLLIALLIYPLLVAACFFVNPKIGKKATTYEEEKGPGFEMPKVVYREKNVFIRQPGNEGIDPYDVLGVTRSMSMEDITSRYKRDILKFHPDKFEDTSDRIKELSARETERLNQAYEMISRERSG